MQILKQLNAAMAYIEEHLGEDIEIEKAAWLACVSADNFTRFFSYMTGMTLNEYVRCRRLTLAAEEVKQKNTPLVDIAVKYGYNNAAAFSRAFTKQHGITPSDYRKSGGSLRIYPPASFQIIIKGAEEMDFRMLELDERQVFGVSKQYDGMGFRTREELRHSMWASDCDDVPGTLCEGDWNQPGNTSYDGIWYGIWRGGRYMIARGADDVKTIQLERQILPAGTYAAFRTECGGLAWEEFPRLFSLIFESWLPTSGYRQTENLAIEVLHLWTDHDIRQKQRYYEVWIPVVRIDSAADEHDGSSADRA